MIDHALAHDPDPFAADSAPLAPRPQRLEETGLSELYLADLLSLHLLEQGVLDLRQLTQRAALPGPIVEQLFAFLRDTGRAEVRGATTGGLLRFALTERGREAAQQAAARDGYVGPAPVPLEQYVALVQRQACRAKTGTRARVQAAFSDTVIRPDILDQLGPAVFSGRATFIHGDPGTGKTYIARRLARLMGGSVLVPHAVLVAGRAIHCHDPAIHQPLAAEANDSSLFLDRGHDPRYLLCRPPVVSVGGELTMDMLEVQYEAGARTYHAPAQMRANNGMLIIDDLGRQRMQPHELLNRWVVPMEERRDVLSLPGGQRFEVPFDVVLMFSSNHDPLQLADPAFLRRIGYKIRFEALTRKEYGLIWDQECRRNALAADPSLRDFVIDHLHRRNGTPLLPCHPRDLIGLALDWLRYHDQTTLSEQALRQAWHNYFMDSGAAGEEHLT